MSCQPTRSTPLQATAAYHARRAGHRVLFLLTLLLAWLPALSPAGDAEQTEYRVKVAFLYNFSRFVKWPDIPPEHFTVCTLGSDPLGGQLDRLLNKTVHERPLRIMHLNSLTQVDDCQLVYIGRLDTLRLHDVIAVLSKQPVLTVSDIDNFTEYGGIIGLRLIDNKFRFEINTEAAGAAGLSISSKLLSLATTIRSAE